MYRTLGNWVIRIWPALLVGWILALVILLASAPAWHEVVEQGEFAFLPADSPSLAAESLYVDGWGKPIASNIVIVIQRERTKLNEADREFVLKTLKPELVAILERVGLAEPAGQAAKAAETTGLAGAGAESPPEETAEQRIKTFASEASSWKNILDSADGRATMVVIELKTEFFDASNATLIDEIEELVAGDGKLFDQKVDVDGKLKPLIPEGLRLALSGSATVGRDMIREAAESSKATELWTVLLVIALLIIIYRSPVLALIPLITVAVATEFSLALLALLAQNGWVGLFNGIEVYVKVLCYGAGVDYCLFLIARFKEELDESDDAAAAVSSSIGKVGDALVASACTVMCGIGMMVFADFGKFRQAGVAITIGLAVVLVASLTFTPALLRLCGRWAFWPHVATKQVQSAGGWLSATGLMGNLLRRNFFELIWKKISELILARPGYVLTLATAIMTPFAIIAVLCFRNLSYGLLTELPQHNASVQGAKAVQEHYPAGIAGPVTILLQNDKVDFTTAEGSEPIGRLVESLFEQRDSLKLADIQNIEHPLGIAVARRLEAEENKEPAEPEVPPDAGEEKPAEKPTGGFSFPKIGLPKIDVEKIAERRITEHRINERYVAHAGDHATHITRLDFLSVDDPFSRDSIAQLDVLKEAIQEAIRKTLPEADSTIIHALGPTPSIVDLKATTDRDQIVVDSYVLVGVFLILLLLLRQLVVCVYLIVSVFFSYLVTLGVTFAVFWLMDPSGFSGLDWKVPTFLFTILIAVGEDYNIFLMTRIREEQVQHGAVQGVAVALQKTGGIISSCGVIMAGTFSSLLAGTLVGMHQLGFALAFGVLLDTFVVRPILVPAFLVMMYEGRFSRLGHLFGVSRAAEEVGQPASGKLLARPATKSTEPAVSIPAERASESADSPARLPAPPKALTEEVKNSGAAPAPKTKSDGATAPIKTSGEV
ncbi:MAG: MMPL family transporter [Planctomycetota bacterium]|nr:MMPL family transporter [Planctomycetota bacterium]MDA1248503.1 MMPL family transporter [Planctomycetota bacterium]